MDQPGGPSLREHFAAVPDPRIDRTKRHQLLDVVTIAICAVRCGADSWVDVELFGQAKLAWLRTFLALPHGIPSHDPFGRVFAALDPRQFEPGFLAWVRAAVTHTAGEVVALDGKTLRRSHDRGAGQAALHLVSAWAATNRLVLGQVAVAAKSNAITALPALLRGLALEGCIVTIDAIRHGVPDGDRADHPRAGWRLRAGPQGEPARAARRGGDVLRRGARHRLPRRAPRVRTHRQRGARAGGEPPALDGG